jgi:hypothetical protein
LIFLALSSMVYVGYKLTRYNKASR